MNLEKLERITRKDVLEAIRLFAKNQWSSQYGDSATHDLVHSGKHYPFRGVLGLAARRIVGRPLHPARFQSELDPKCFRVLRSLGFKISKRTAELTGRSMPQSLSTKRILTAADFGGKKPPVIPGKRWSPVERDAIAAYARAHNNEQTKQWFGCSAHWVGRLRREYGIPLVGRSGHVPDRTPEPPGEALETKVRRLRQQPIESPPFGVAVPDKVTVTSEERRRDPAVKAWVLENAKGVCELCRIPAPFRDSFGVPFLEVHHVVQLANDGPDQITNAVALCPNCHRRCHVAEDRNDATERMYRRIERLVRP